MRRLLAALLVLATAGATAAAQEADPGPCATPDSIAFRGNRRITETLLRADLGIMPGVALNYRQLQRGIQALYATGQFDDIQIDCAASDQRATLVVTVRERPILGTIAYSGIDRFSTGTVRDLVDVPAGRPLDPAMLARSVARIDSLYESAGYYLAEVNVDTVAADSAVNLTIRVIEGRRLAIAGVRIRGNQRLAGKTIVKAMEARPEGFFWWQKGEFDEDKLAGDITERIPQLYGRHGFIDMQITRDTVVVDRERGKALIELTIDEGPQYQVGSFESSGARRFSSVDIARFYPFGDRGRTLRQALRDLVERDRDENVFDRSAWEEATRGVQTAYANEGYIYASVRPVVERVPAAAGDSAPRVNLRWEIEERTPAIVNRVEILGNDVTVENCIRDQIIVLPGDVFNQDLLIRSYHGIANLGFFETPLPPPDTRQANEQGDVDIIFRVKEKNTGNVNFGASVGQGYGIGGFIGFDQPNLFGRCKRGSLQWQFGQYVNDFNLGYTDPRIRGSRVSGTVNAYHSRSQFVIRNIGRSTRTGASMRFGFPVPQSRWTRFFVDYSAERVRYGDEGLVGSIQCGRGDETNDRCFRSTIGATLDRDTRIDMPFASAGTHQSLTSSFTGGPLGGSAAYQRVVGEMRSYTTLGAIGGQQPGSQPLKVVFGLSTRVGALFGDPGPFFVSQQFALGGVQYGEALRGYEEFSITPNGYIGTGQLTADRASFGSAFFTTSAELGLRVSQQLYLAAFFDAGNLWRRAQDFNPGRLYRGAGVGASLVTPLGPLGIDLGYGFDRVDQLGRRDPKWQVHFKFGQLFY